jgi:hypothetical protein
MLLKLLFVYIDIADIAAKALGKLGNIVAETLVNYKF